MEWKISRGKGLCMDCQADMEEGQVFFSALIDADLEFQRKDYCPDCWEKKKEAVFSYWKTRVPDKDSTKKPTIDNEALLQFFQRLEPETEPARQNFRYLLGLMLMRKKVFKFEDIERDEDKEFLILRRPGEEERHRVFDPRLPKDELDKLKDDLYQLLYFEA
jgi:hypothetical protein